MSAMILHVQQIALSGHSRQLCRGQPVARPVSTRMISQAAVVLPAFMQVPERRMIGADPARRSARARHCGHVRRLAVHHRGAEDAHAQRLAEIGVGGATLADHPAHVQDVQHVAGSIRAGT